MATNYFILTKSKDEKIFENKGNGIFILNSDSVYILPRNLSTCYINDGLFEKYLIQWCIDNYKSPDKIFLDVGAHTGTYAISMAKWFKEVYAFECQKMTFYSLCGSIALSNLRNVNAINFGLGSPEQVGEKTLKIISPDGGGSTVQSVNCPVMREEKIQMRTLDSFHLANIGFIKIDIEGNELEMLKGSVEALRNSDYPPILFESNGENKALFDFIQQIGYAFCKVNGATNMFLATHTK